MKNKITNLVDIHLSEAEILFSENSSLLASTTNDLLAALSYQYSILDNSVTLVCGMGAPQLVINTITNAAKIGKDTLTHLSELHNESGFNIVWNIRTMIHERIAWVHMTPNVPEHRRTGDTSETTTEVYTKTLEEEWGGIDEKLYGVENV